MFELNYTLDRNLWRYALERGHAEVEGWIGEAALSGILAVGLEQRRRGITGAVGEIGVHHGRLFILLGLMRAPGEVALAIDVFEDQHLNVDGSGLGDLSRFQRNMETFGVAPQGLRVVKADSLALDGAGLRAHLQGQPLRLLSIDGGHTVRHVLNDIGLAEAVLAPEGVAIVDDFLYGDWPGVAEGCIKYLGDGRSSLVPFAFGDNKLYLCRAAAHPRWWKFVSQDLKPNHHHFRQVELCGHVAAHTYLWPVQQLGGKLFRQA